MMDRFNDIIDVEFTANMEHRLDEVEEGKRQWQEVLRDFYQGFHQEMENAEEALKDTRLKVPDEGKPMRFASCAVERWSSRWAVLAALWPAPGIRSAKHQAHCGTYARPVPEMRQRHAEAEV